MIYLINANENEKAKETETKVQELFLKELSVNKYDFEH